MQMLYALELSGDGVDYVVENFWLELPGDAEGREYADQLVRGVAGSLVSLDERIQSASTNWRLERMRPVDRNVLRLGVYELSQQPGVPRAVILDEAVELAKRYGSDGSSAFVNGVLDKAADEAGRTD